MDVEKPLTTEETWDLRVKAVEEKLGYKICGARGKRKLTPCPNKAGKGTDHVGQGRCKYHGGGASNLTAKNYKHGLYSKINIENPTLRQKMEELATSTDVFDLRNEILKVRAIIDIMAEKSDYESVVRFAGDVSKIVERLHNIEVGRRLVISIDNVSVIIENVKVAIMRHVPDEHTRHLIATELANMKVSTALPAPKEEKVIDAEYREIVDAKPAAKN